MQRKLILALVATGFAVAACGSDPYTYSEPRYVSSGSTYNRDVAYNDYGRVVAIDVVNGGHHTSGAGAVVGGIVGGVVGHQIGSGRGNTAATILGAGAGAYAGNEVEKNAKTSSYWAVAIRMDNGQTRNFTYTNQPPVHEGERVRLIDSGRRLSRISG